jgi:hypothetical protein
LVELKQIKHNEMHMYLTATHSNSLKTKFVHFLEKVREKATVSHYVCQRRRQESEVQGKINRDLKQLMKQESKDREREKNAIS